MERYLCSCGVLIKGFKEFALSVTAKVKAAAYGAAAQAKRPAQYLVDAKLSKEDYARQIALEDGIKEGLVVLLSAKEPCYSYSVRGDRASQKLHLVIEPRVCTHFYHYYMHAEFGLMHVRVQSWFPFTVEVGSVRFFVCGSVSCVASNTLESCSNTVNWSRRDRLSKAVGSSRANCE
jgi:hypothetical protein